jgi:thymidylate synthase
MNQAAGETFASLDEAFLKILGLLLNTGTQAAPRDLSTSELTPFSFSIADPRRRYVSVPERRWSISYAIGELAWHLRGSDAVEEIAFYAPRWRKLANGKAAISGSSYGAKIFSRRHGQQSQWERVLAVLREDRATRRAVLYFADPDADSLDPKADVACALSLQLLIRGRQLDAICTMRSNDAVLGLPYDVFLFTMLQEMAASALGCELGTYYHQVGSLHLYTSQIPLARRVIESRPTVYVPMAHMQELAGKRILLDGEAMCRRGVRRFELSTRSYWGDLLAVVARWARVHIDQHDDAGPDEGQDPVLSALFDQWYASRSVSPGDVARHKPGAHVPAAASHRGPQS